MSESLKETTDYTPAPGGYCTITTIPEDGKVRETLRILRADCLSSK